MEPAQFTLEEIAMMLGQRDLQIANLEKQLRAALDKIPKIPPKLEAVEAERA